MYALQKRLLILLKGLPVERALQWRATRIYDHQQTDFDGIFYTPALPNRPRRS